MHGHECNPKPSVHKSDMQRCKVCNSRSRLIWSGSHASGAIRLISIHICVRKDVKASGHLGRGASVDFH